MDEESTFDDAMYAVMQEFTSDEFEKILKAKTKFLEQKWRRRFWGHILSYFTFPKVVITIALTMSIILLSEWFTPMLIVAVFGVSDAFSFRKRKEIDFKSFLVAKTFRRQIYAFYVVPFLFAIFNLVPTHLEDGGLSIGLISYALACSFIIISQWACIKHFYSWLSDELKSNYPEYLARN